MDFPIEKLYIKKYYVYEHYIYGNLIYIGKGSGCRAIDLYNRNTRVSIITKK